KTMSNFQPVDFGTSVNAGGYEVRVHSAGHVPGAAMYEIVGHDTTVFTGDLNTLSTHLVYGEQPVKCDNLIVETTYAGRSHPDRLKLEYSFVRKIKEITSRGGKAIIPAFAVGRTQELLLILRSEKFDVQLDGMGSSINRMYLRWPKYLRSAKNLRAAVRKADVVKRARDKLDYDCDVIVTTSGMLDGGPVLEYIQRFKDDSRNGILLTGYQVEGTNGRMLMEEGKISLYGSEEKIKAEVEYFDLSAHAGHDDLVRFINDCDPERVILMHGDNRQLIADELEGREIIIPKEGEWTDI
ncbi:MAG: MBL fold metallo-hydrolase, partial [Thermoplasmata archaeon]|nr:MBL fold metallo-hydrolase [Thermoplasmata archaeon]